MENMSLKCGDFVTLLTVLCQKKYKRVNENCKYVISVNMEDKGIDIDLSF